MIIGRLILINSSQMRLILAANITMACATNFPMQGKGMQRSSDRITGTTRS